MSEPRARFTLTLAVSLAALIPLGFPSAWAQEEKKPLEQQLQEQQAKNEALRQRIAELEKILATDVCNNPEAAALAERGAATPAPATVPAKKE